MSSRPQINELISRELASIQDTKLAQYIREHLVTPYVIDGHWPYGEPGQTYPCWVVLEDAGSGIAIVFSEFGFAPNYPWGVILLADRQMGMDCCWHVSLEHAFRSCSLWAGKNPPDYEIP